MQVMRVSADILQNIIASVSNVVADILFFTECGGKGRVHHFPFSAIKFDGILYPADGFHIDVNPGMVDFTAVADGQFGGNGQGPQHSDRQCCVVKTDSCLGAQGVIHIRKITGFYGGSFFLVICNIFRDILVNGSKCFQICFGVCGKLCSKVNCLIVLGKIHILIWV